MQDTQERTGVIASNGIGEVSFSPTRGQWWTVKQVSVEAPGVGASSSASVFLNSSKVCAIRPIDGVASGLPYVDVYLGSRLRVRWTAATAGVIIKATIIYDWNPRGT